nr:MAG TPA: hypothetical protein [Caudoviricetes sp.]
MSFQYGFDCRHDAVNDGGYQPPMRIILQGRENV